MDGAGVDATDANASDVVGMVDGDALHGERAVQVDVGSGQGIDDHVHEWQHVTVAVLGIEAGEAVHGRGVDHVFHAELELRVVGTQVHHEVQAVVEGLLGVCAATVDLVDADHDGEPGCDGVAQHEAGLGHGALGRIDEQDGSVGHLEDALDLAAKVGVAGRVDDVDLDAVVLDGYVLGEDGDAALALLVIGVEHALLDLLVVTEGVGRLQHLVDEGRLAVVDVGDDCDVPDVLLEHRHLFDGFKRCSLTTVYQAQASPHTTCVTPRKLLCPRTVMGTGASRGMPDGQISGSTSPAGAGSVHLKPSPSPLPSTYE